MKALYQQWLHNINKFALLTNYVAPSVCEYITDCDMYESAITVLKELHVKPQNEIYAQHVLATHRQEMSESIDIYLQILKCLSNDWFYCYDSRTT